MTTRACSSSWAGTIPLSGAFWIEYASAEEVRRAQAEIEAAASSSVGVSQETYNIAETDVKREGGMWPGIPLESFVEGGARGISPAVDRARDEDAEQHEPTPTPATTRPDRPHP